MRPELERMQLIEDYLHQRLNPDRRADLEFRLLIDDTLRQEVEVQKQLYGAIRQEGRRQLRRELEGIHQRLSTQFLLRRIGAILAFLAGVWLWWQWVTL
jgi:hypothetical protein